MGRTFYMKDKTLNYFKGISKSCSFSVGLIIGQSNLSSDYIVHVTRTQIPIVESNTSPQQMTDVKESWLADHAKQVTRLLPGGLWVLGVFVCAPQDVLQNTSAQSRLKSCLHNLTKTLSSDPLLYANSPSKEKLALFYNSATHMYHVKSIDVSNLTGVFKPADYKQWDSNNILQWISITSNYELDQMPKPTNRTLPVKVQLKEVLLEISKLIDSAVVALEGEIRDGHETLETVHSKKKKTQSDEASKNQRRQLSASLFIPFSGKLSKLEEEEMLEIIKCDVELRFLGVVSSCVFLHEKATVTDAVAAVKQDITRSLACRLEMHWDSLVDEEYDSPEDKQSIHEPPRRVAFPVEGIKLTEYLFPGETASEVVSSVKELLDVDIAETDVEACELMPDPLELAGKTTQLQGKSDDFHFSPSIGWLLGALSFALVLIGIALAIYTQQKRQR